MLILQNIDPAKEEDLITITIKKNPPTFQLKIVSVHKVVRTNIKTSQRGTAYLTFHSLHIL